MFNVGILQSQSVVEAWIRHVVVLSGCEGADLETSPGRALFVSSQNVATSHPYAWGSCGYCKVGPESGPESGPGPIASLFFMLHLNTSQYSVTDVTPVNIAYGKDWYMAWEGGCYCTAQYRAAVARYILLCTLLNTSHERNAGTTVFARQTYATLTNIWKPQMFRCQQNSRLPPDSKLSRVRQACGGVNAPNWIAQRLGVSLPGVKPE